MDFIKESGDYWDTKVLEKIEGLLNFGADFIQTQWRFDWSKKLSENENISNYGFESRALVKLSAIGVINIKSAKAVPHIKRYPVINQHGLDTLYDPARKNFVGRSWYRDYWITGFDYDKFLAQKKGRGTKTKYDDKLSDQISNQPLDINKLKVSPKNYDSTNGVLNLAGRIIQIRKQQDRKSETKEAKLIRQLFSVKYFFNGVGFGQFYSVKVENISRKEHKKARSLVTAINKKLPDELKGQELIKCDRSIFYVNPAYKER